MGMDMVEELGVNGYKGSIAGMDMVAKAHG